MALAAICGFSIVRYSLALNYRVMTMFSGAVLSKNQVEYVVKGFKYAYSPFTRRDVR
jgi:hypothetical protein